MRIRELAAAMDAKPSGLRIQWAVVAAVNTGPPISVDLTIAGSTVTTPGVRRLASYSPTLGDTVLVLANGTDKVVLGKLG